MIPSHWRSLIGDIATGQVVDAVEDGKGVPTPGRGRLMEGRDKCVSRLSSSSVRLFLDPLGLPAPGRQPPFAIVGMVSLTCNAPPRLIAQDLSAVNA